MRLHIQSYDGITGKLSGFSAITSDSRSLKDFQAGMLTVHGRERGCVNIADGVIIGDSFGTVQALRMAVKTEPLRGATVRVAKRALGEVMRAYRLLDGVLIASGIAPGVHPSTAPLAPARVRRFVR